MSASGSLKVENGLKRSPQVPSRCSVLPDAASNTTVHSGALPFCAPVAGSETLSRPATASSPSTRLGLGRIIEFSSFAPPGVEAPSCGRKMDGKRGSLPGAGADRQPGLVAGKDVLDDG